MKVDQNEKKTTRVFFLYKYRKFEAFLWNLKLSVNLFFWRCGNSKQKNFYISKCKIFLHFTTTDPTLLHLRNLFVVWL